MINEVEGIETSVGSDEALICLDPRIYTREAIIRTCYAYTDVAYLHCPESADGKLHVHVALKQTTPTLENPRPSTLTDVLRAFCNSLMDFELRRQVETETAQIRQLILAKAFSESGVLEDDPPGSIADPVESTHPSSLVQIMDGLPKPAKQ
ncbi:MAG TPA: His-Xaa-Ser system protein HxsD [Terriglobales bacterium]|nr:His-Xaa-Ser system protein HxsD [Terriglobales bacterium]